MSTYAEHYAEAEGLLAEAAHLYEQGHIDSLCREALVHATLAVAAAMQPRVVKAS